MKSSSGLLCTSLFQLIIGFILLTIYETYKVSYMNSDPYVQEMKLNQTQENDTNSTVQYYIHRSVSTPLDCLFYLSLFNNIFCLLFCLVALLNSIKELVIGFFVFNVIQVIVSFHLFIDVWTDAHVKNWSKGDLGSHEKAATAFVFFNFLISLFATILAVRSLQDLKHKAREEYNRLSVISDNLQFEADNDKL